MLRLALAALVLAALAGCGPGAVQFGPAGEPSISNYNPISGSRGGSSAHS